MIIFKRQPDNTFLRSGELPLGTKKVYINIPERSGEGARPAYDLAYAIKLLETGPWRYNEYWIVPIVLKVPLTPTPSEILQADLEPLPED